jgi:hypothetical protein
MPQPPFLLAARGLDAILYGGQGFFAKKINTLVAIGFPNPSVWAWFLYEVVAWRRESWDLCVEKLPTLNQSEIRKFYGVL